MQKRIETKDLINIGLYTAIYFVLFFVTGMIGYLPILMLLIPLICPIITGIVFILFMTRVHHFGMVTIMSVLLGLLMMITGHHWIVVLISSVTGLVADLIMYLGKYRRWPNLLLGYIVFSQWLLGMMVPIFFTRTSFFSDLTQNYGASYATQLEALTPAWVFYLMILLVAIGAVIGAYFGRQLLNKHFKKAGVS